MDFEDQILKTQDATLVFLSETHFVVTENLYQLLANENVSEIDQNLKIKKSKVAIGTAVFNVRIKKSDVIVTLYDRRMLLSELIKNAKDFDTYSLSNTHKIISFKKNRNIYIAIPSVDNNFLYLNKRNQIKQEDLGNILDLGTMNQFDLIDKVEDLRNLHVPFTKIILNNTIQETKKLPFTITRKNHFTQSSEFYFIDDPTYEVSETENKQILTYGFSRNNSHNYFDINISNDFNELKLYYNNDFNYNKYYLNYKLKKEVKVTTEFTLRLIQFNCLLPVMYVDHKKIANIDFNQDNYHFKVLRKYLNLRHRLLPYLYSAFTTAEDFNTNIYKRVNGAMVVHNNLMFFPILNKCNSYTNVHFLKMDFDDIYYDIESKEKIDSTHHDFFGINKMPIFAKAGSIIPFTVPNTSSIQNGYEIQVYPNANSQYLLHYKDREQEGVEHAYTKFTLTYEQNKMVLSLKTLSNKALRPRIFRFNFVNIRKNSDIVIENVNFNIDYNNDTKSYYLDLYYTNNDLEIVVTNEYGLEIDRNQEFLEKKLENFFNIINCSAKEKTIYKYKIKPYLHESIDELILRIDRHAKFIPIKQRKNLYNVLLAYKK